MQAPGWVLTGIGAVTGLVTGSYLTVLIARGLAGAFVLAAVTGLGLIAAGRATCHCRAAAAIPGSAERPDILHQPATAVSVLLPRSRPLASVLLLSPLPLIIPVKGCRRSGHDW